MVLARGDAVLARGGDPPEPPAALRAPPGSSPWNRAAGGAEAPRGPCDRGCAAPPAVAVPGRAISGLRPSLLAVASVLMMSPRVLGPWLTGSPRRSVQNHSLGRGRRRGSRS